MTLGDGFPLRRRSNGAGPSGARGRRDALQRFARNVQFDAASIALGGLILWFAGLHLRLWIEHPGHFVGIGQVALELVQGTLFFIRRQDRGGRRPFSVWAATVIGSWGFLLARPAGAGFFDSPFLFNAEPLFGTEGLWLAIQLFGTLMAIASLTCLGRSFGLVAANRGVQTNGAYRIVRHPAYASYFIVQGSYLFENLSFWNLAIFGIVVVAQLVRIHQEEATLLGDETYRRYCERVRSRLVPGVY